MPDDSAQERTEQPTDKRRSDAREKGNVAKSTEINSALILFCSLLVFLIAGPWMMEEIMGMMRSYVAMVSNPHMETPSFLACFNQALWMTFKISLPIALTILVVGTAANFLQVGFLFTATPLMPKLEKINPLAGFKRLFSLRSVVETLKSLLKIGIIGTVAYLSIKAEYVNFLKLAATSTGIIWTFAVDVTMTIVFRICLALLLLAILDFMYQRWEYERNLKMTRDEIKEERKQMEGDPQIKSRIRSLQREMARRRMMKEVPKATVVVTNPTFIAIAVRYEPDEMDTPKILAKGKRLIAERIREVAREHGIPIVEDKPLARAMYDKVQPGDDLPMEFFAAVAEILAYVYRLKHRQAA